MDAVAQPAELPPVHQEPAPQSRLPELEELAAGIAQSVHDPLVVIASQAERLLDRIENAEDRRAARAILDQSFQARRTLDTVLAYARPTHTEPAPALINYVLRRILAEHVDRLRAKGVRIEEHYAEGLPRVRIDRPQFEQALLCLMANAEDAMARAGGVFGVETKLTADGKGVLIRISDTGSGIDADSRDRVFQPFYSSRASGERPGLGLTVAQTLIANHGGKLALAESATGAAFTITLPSASDRSASSSPIADPATSEETPRHEAVRAPVPPDPANHSGHGNQSAPTRSPVDEFVASAPAPAPAPARATATAMTHPMVLIVDDDEDLREVLSETLKLGGYEVQTASDGGEALKAIDRDSVQLVLLDMHMPGVNGMQVLEKVKIASFRRAGHRNEQRCEPGRN
jgi:CheY-like chemotaxis protein